MNVYKITCLVNDKIYVGKDTHDNPKYLGSGVLIKRAVKKYGKDNFKKEILETCNTLEELNVKEKYWLNKLQPFYPRGYNILNGSTGGDVLTNNPNRDVAIQHMRENAPDRHGVNNPFFGKHHTTSTIEKINSYDRYSKHNKDTCDCAACKSIRGEQTGANNPNFGKHLSEVVKQNISKKNSGRLVGDKNPNYGNHKTYEEKYGLEKAATIKNKLSTSFSGEKHPNYGKRGINCKIFKVIPLEIKEKIVQLYISNTIGIKNIAYTLTLSANKVRQVLQEYNIIIRKRGERIGNKNN